MECGGHGEGRGEIITFILAPTLEMSKLIRVTEFQSCTKSCWRCSFSFQASTAENLLTAFFWEPHEFESLQKVRQFTSQTTFCFTANSRIFLYAISVTTLANSSANEGLLWITLVQSLTTWLGNPLSTVWAKNVSQLFHLRPYTQE